MTHPYNWPRKKALDVVSMIVDEPEINKYNWPRKTRYSEKMDVEQPISKISQLKKAVQSPSTFVEKMKLDKPVPIVVASKKPLWTPYAGTRFNPSRSEPWKVMKFDQPNKKAYWRNVDPPWPDNVSYQNAIKKFGSCVYNKSFRPHCEQAKLNWLNSYNQVCWKNWRKKNAQFLK